MKEIAEVYDNKGNVIDTYEYEVPDPPVDEVKVEIDALKERVAELERLQEIALS